MTRNLNTLIEQFNQAKELDRHFEFEGEPYWLEVDGVRTRMVDAWLNDLTSEEYAIFKAYLAQIANSTAKTLGYENCNELFKDAGQKIFAGLKMGINTS